MDYLLDTAEKPFPQNRSEVNIVELAVNVGAGITTKSEVQFIPNRSAFIVPIVPSPTFMYVLFVSVKL